MLLNLQYICWNISIFGFIGKAMMKNQHSCAEPPSCVNRPKAPPTTPFALFWHINVGVPKWKSIQCTVIPALYHYWMAKHRCWDFSDFWNVHWICPRGPTTPSPTTTARPNPTPSIWQSNQWVTGPSGIPGFLVGQNPGILENEIPGFFGICLYTVQCKGTFYGRSRPSSTALGGQNIRTVRTHLT